MSTSHISLRYSQRTYLKLLNLEPEEKEPHVVPLKQYELEAQVLAHHWFWAVDPHSTFDSIKVRPDFCSKVKTKKRKKKKRKEKKSGIT